MLAISRTRSAPRAPSLASTSRMWVRVCSRVACGSDVQLMVITALLFPPPMETHYTSQNGITDKGIMKLLPRYAKAQIIRL